MIMTRCWPRLPKALGDPRLRWCWRGMYTTVRFRSASSNPERQRANLHFTVELDDQDIAEIDGLERGRIYQDPATHEEF